MKTNKKNLKFLLAIFVFIPSITFAAFSLASATFKSVIEEVVSYVNLLINLLMLLSSLVFAWGLSKIVLNSGSPADVKNGRDYMIWGIIAFFCLLGVYGIIAFIQKEFGWSFAGPNLLLLPE